jgi:hypothetical protein
MINVFVSGPVFGRLPVDGRGFLHTAYCAPTLLAINTHQPSRLGDWNACLLEPAGGCYLLLKHNQTGMVQVLSDEEGFRHLDWGFQDCLVRLLEHAGATTKHLEWVAGGLHPLQFQRTRQGFPRSEVRRLTSILDGVLETARFWYEPQPAPMDLSIDMAVALETDGKSNHYRGMRHPDALRVLLEQIDGYSCG